MYEDEELNSLFAACDSERELWYEFFLMTGMREQEVMHTYWSDINLTPGLFGSVTSPTADGHRRRTKSAKFLSLRSWSRD